MDIAKLSVIVDTMIIHCSQTGQSREWIWRFPRLVISMFPKEAAFRRYMETLNSENCNEALAELRRMYDSAIGEEATTVRVLLMGCTAEAIIRSSEFLGNKVSSYAVLCSYFDAITSLKDRAVQQIQGLFLQICADVAEEIDVKIGAIHGGDTTHFCPESRYFGDWTCRSDLERDFAVHLDDTIHIIAAYHEGDDESGCAGGYYIDTNTHKLHRFHGSYCSDWGLEYQWKPDEVSISDIKADIVYYERPHYMNISLDLSNDFATYMKIVLQKIQELS